MISSVNRLSSLLDGVICHILSFLPTKLSVATSVLGKRWRFLWAHVPCLDFSGNDLTGETEHSDIINRFILLHEAKRMNTFRLSLVNCNEYQLETWISAAIKRNIRDIYLALYGFGDRLMLLSPLFTCKTVVDMRLSGGKRISSSVNIHLPSLRKLVLDLVEFEDDEALTHLLSGCPLLKKLTLVYSFIGNEKKLGCINISSPSLETLDVCLLHVYEDIPVYGIVINAKALRYLYMGNCPLGRITNSTTMTSLDEACIFFQYDFYLYMNSESYSNVVKFLDCLCNVKCLKISSYGGEESYVNVALPSKTIFHIARARTKALFINELYSAWLETVGTWESECSKATLSESEPEPEPEPDLNTNPSRTRIARLELEFGACENPDTRRPIYMEKSRRLSGKCQKIPDS
ncbi:F-box/RNI-like/FBD-like domains-containing protein [Striga asiatica]|uniref:F-box/RNI-like/FBD-like domains-containing protein n=1 Tax=Striga asiatica TaxID=4170 RepID=A0A5A7QCQ7_STRAF|nr:F-box/RNI-like/FBD-like domains-containing protein [Striga asiatica]